MNSPKAFRICLAAPPAYPHYACFNELVRLLWLAIRENGYECDFARNTPHPDRCNILLGYHLLPFTSQWSEAETVIWQLEQLDNSPKQWNSQREAHLRNARMIWDFAPANLEFLSSRGLTGRLLVPGYHSALNTISHDAHKDIDVLFYGSIGPRRQHILGTLAHKINLKAIFGIYSTERDKLIQRSRLVINIHHYPSQLFESVRISYLLNNRVAVLSEKADDIPWPNIGLATVDYDHFGEACAFLRAEDARLDALAEFTHQKFAELYPMASIMSPLLKELSR